MNISRIVNGSEISTLLPIYVAGILGCHAHGRLIPFAGLREREKRGVFFKYRLTLVWLKIVMQALYTQEK